MSLALLFSPQGSQAIGMGRELALGAPAARATFDEADALLGWSVSETCWNGPDERLNDTRQTQPCLLTVSVAAWRALRDRVDLAPSFVAGHSVGEYAALVAADVLPFAAALRLVARRGALMAEAGADGGMAAIIGLDRAAVDAVVSSISRPTELVVANDNAPGQVVISGRRDALVAAEAAMRAAGAKRVVTLPVSGAFHSPLMSGVADALADAFGDETWRDATMPVVSNVTCEPLTDAGRIRALLAEQVRSPVEWVGVVRRMADDGVDTVVELGPGAALVGMVRRIAPDIRGLAVNDAASLEAAVDALRTPVEASAP
jgi:[acyl-carrier-protein] S-malonyltransferase